MENLKRKSTEEEKVAMRFLNHIRNTGKINMFAAPPLLREYLGMSSQEASRVFTLWTVNFNEEGNYDEISEK